MDKRFGRECTQFWLTRVRGAVAKGHLVVFQLDQAAVADGYAENIRRQIPQGCAAIAHRFAVNNPILLPDLRWYSSKQGRFDQCLPELAAKYLGERLHRQQKILSGRLPGLSIRGQAACRDQVVDVWVVCQVAAPEPVLNGVKDVQDT